MSHSPIGSLWNRWDLHFHTPSSYDYEQGDVSNEEIIEALTASSVRVVAITDHHRIDVDRVQKLQALAGDHLTILPGIELRTDQGGKPIHYTCIFPEDCDLAHVWTKLEGTLGLTKTDLRAKGGDDKIYVPIKDAATLTRELGGLVTIHAGSKSNSIENIRNHEEFQQRIKFDITKNYVDFLEIGQIKDIDVHYRTIFPATGLEKPLIICSDNHNARAYGVKVPLWVRADPTFRGLRMATVETRERIAITQRPPDSERLERDKTRIIRSISFEKTADQNIDEWFSGTTEFNPGLIAIIGNKGSGKSALADSLGLLGLSKNTAFFSFLNRDRFRHPTSGRASIFSATIEWASGEKAEMALDQDPEASSVERVKYLPQNHVEAVCNGLAALGDDGFESELKAVIFSHVPELDRLGKASLDDLVVFKTAERQKRIDTLLGQLRAVSRHRASLEGKTDPDVSRQVEQKVANRRLEIEALATSKPAPVASPAENGGAAVDPKLAAALAKDEKARQAIAAEIQTVKTLLAKSQIDHAWAVRLLEKIENFGKDYAVFVSSVEEDCQKLGLSLADFVDLKLLKAPVEKVRDRIAGDIARQEALLKPETPDGPQAKLSEIEERMKAIRDTLDAPNKAHQAYLVALADWEKRNSDLLGAEEGPLPDSLRGLEAELATLAGLPAEIAKDRVEQIRIAMEVHGEKVAQAEVYRTYYGAVQTFINSHALAQNKMHLEFRAELSEEPFADQFVALLAQNRRGSFMGIDEGRARVESLLERASWDNSASVAQFLQDVDHALHVDLRDGGDEEMLLKEQVAKKRKPEEVFDLLYGLQYIRPRCILKWDGKDLSMLSPGERGILLLVFYLLVDKSDVPLIIDQPEGNLDNQTVSQVLIDCIREARKRRQVFIVTHNPNLAVVCDADQVIYSSIDRTNNNKITYIAGAIENPEITGHLTDVLEGTLWAFGVRDNKYQIGRDAR